MRTVFEKKRGLSHGSRERPEQKQFWTLGTTLSLEVTSLNLRSVCGKFESLEVTLKIPGEGH